MDTPSLFVESIEEAIAEVARACGGRKAFAVAMWPCLLLSPRKRPPDPVIPMMSRKQLEAVPE
ncbi:MAG: hypothetical protein M9936_28835 [Caldilinea sp.]|nr:hypothetical protein [Caldilinea sp.]